MTEPSFFESVSLILIGIFGTAVSTAIIQHFRTKSQYFIRMQHMIDKLDKRSFRIAKAQILQAQMIDTQTRKAHPEAAFELEKLTKEMLEDSEGNL